MWADELTRRYLPDRPIVTNRGASRLLLSAEASLKLEAFAEANRLAEQSLSTFRQCGETCGQADAARLLSVVMIHQDRRKEADRLLKDELSIFQTSAAYTSKSAEARLLLALAEVNSDRRGQKKREEALKFVGQARTLAIEEADVGLEASSLSVMAKIFIKYKGDAKACNKEAHRLATQALQLYEQTEDLRGQAIASHHSGIAQGNLGEMTASLQYMADSMAHWRKAQDPIMEANAQIMVGQLLLKGGLVRQAATAAEQALALYHATGVTGARELRAMQTAVRAQIASGEPWRAIWTAEDAIARYRERHDRTNEAQALLCLASGYTFSPSGRDQQEVPAKMQSKMKPPPKEAVEAMQLALQIARQLNDSTLEAQVMAHLSTIHVQRTEMEEAIFAAHDALSHREVKDVASKGTAFQSLTSAHLHNKDFADAEGAARAQRDFSRKEGSWQGDANGLLSMAQVLLAEKKFEESADKAKEAQGLFAEHKDRRGEAKALLQVARARQTAAEYEKALHVAERAQDLFLRVNDLMGKSEALQVMAECRSKLLKKQQEQSTKQLRARSKGNAKAPLPWEDLSRAATVSKQAKEAAHDVGDVQAEAAALCVIAQIHVFNGRPQSEILETLEDAMALAVEAEDGRTEATALLLKAEIHLQAEELQEALNAARQAELLLGRMDDEAASAKVEEILNKLRGFEFRVDEAPVAPAYRSYGYDPRMALPLVSGPDPAVVKATIQEVTKKMVGKEDDLEADMPLMDLGINSTNAVIFRNKLTSEFKDLELPATLVFDYPTVRALQGLVVEQTTAAALANAPEPMWAANAAMAQMAMAAHRAVDAVAVRRKIQEVTKGMVGSDLDIDADMPLMDIGINSMNAVVFRNKLGSTFEGVELPSTLVFDYPNIRAISDLLTQITE